MFKAFLLLGKLYFINKKLFPILVHQECRMVKLQMVNDENFYFNKLKLKFLQKIIIIRIKSKKTIC